MHRSSVPLAVIVAAAIVIAGLVLLVTVFTLLLLLLLLLLRRLQIQGELGQRIVMGLGPWKYKLGKGVPLPPPPPATTTDYRAVAVSSNGVDRTPYVRAMAMQHW